MCASLLFLCVGLGPWACQDEFQSLDREDAAVSEVGTEAPDTGVSDAAELGCVGPNPSFVDNPGSYCTRYCVDVIWPQECFEGTWRCPPPGAVLVRDCTWTERRDVQVWDLGEEDAGGLFDFGMDAETFD